MEICVLTGKDCGLFSGRRPEQETVEISELQQLITLYSVPLRRGRATHRQRAFLENLTQDAILTDTPALARFQRLPAQKSLLFYYPAQTLQAFCRRYRIFLAKEEVGVFVPRLSSEAERILSELAPFLRFVTLYTLDTEKGLSLLDDLLETYGLSVRLCDLARQDDVQNKLIIKITDDLSFFLREQNIEVRNMQYAPPAFFEQYPMLPMAKIFDFLCRAESENGYFRAWNIKIRDMM